MEVILLGIYGFFVWLIFYKFKWLPMEIFGRTAAISLSICTKQILHRSLSEEPRWLCSFWERFS